MRFTRSLLALSLLAAAHGAQAHTFGAHGAGLAAGLVHPLLGLDHLLAMVAVGLWAAQIGGALRWQAPLAFMAMMAVGAAAGMGGVDSSWAEPGIAASVLVLGLLLAFAVRLPAPAGMTLVGTFALFHGAAHGAELPEAAGPFAYALGFLLATGALHIAGLALGGFLRRHRTDLIRLGGMVTTAIGAWMLLAV